MSPCLYRQFTERLVAGFLLLLVLPSGAVPQNFCRICHSEVEVEFRESVHYREDLTCATCHRGDPSTYEMERAHGADFRAVPSRDQIPAFCAECHAASEKMRPYGIPIDQYALYLTSEHGRKLMEGNAQVAICTDCHGTHRILPRSAPDNPVNRLNISATCGRCHADAELMSSSGLSADIVDQYEESVHARALRRQGDPHAPDCSRCHGSHGAAPPGTGDVSKVCGQCHSHTRDAFRLSPHQGAMSTNGYGDCATCHDNHRVLVPGPELWRSTCLLCHETSSEAARTGEKILALFTQAKEEIEKAHQVVARASEIPLDVADYEARLNAAATYLVEAAPMSHSLDIASIEEITRKSRSISQEVQAEVHEKILVFEGRKFIVIFVWLYILITIVAIQYYKRSLRQ